MVERLQGRSILSTFDALVKRIKAYRTLLDFSFASSAFSLAGMLAGFVVLKWIDPVDIGLWQSLLIIESYLIIFQIGVFKGLGRELPYRRGTKDPSAEALAGTAQMIAFYGSALFICAGVIAFFLYPDLPRIRIALPAVFFASSATLYNNYLDITYRADREFKRLARIRFALAILTIGTLPLIYYLGFIGLPLRYIIMRCGAAILCHIWRPINAPIKFSRKHFVTLLRIGFPIFCSAYLVGMSKTFPKIILLSKGGSILVGLFAPAMVVLSLLTILPISVSQYISPLMSFRFGKTGDPGSLWPMAKKLAIGGLVFSVPLIIVGYLFVPLIVKMTIPKYIDSITAIRWTMVTGAFVGSSLAVHSMRSLKAWRYIAFYTGAQVLTSYGFPYAMASYMDNTLNGVAAGYAISQAVCFVVGLRCVYLATNSARYSRY